MQTLIKPYLLLTFILLGCSLQPDQFTENETLTESGEALALFQTEASLSPYFDQAAVIVVYPGAWRAGSGFGAGYALGSIYKQGQLIGYSRLMQVNIGPNFGVQKYRQILFFKTEASFQRMLDNSVEIVGQAHASWDIFGAATTPAFNPEVAIFTQLRGGALLEASIGGHRYEFLMLPPMVTD